MVWVVQTVRIGEMGVGAAEFFRSNGHFFRKQRHGSGVVSSERMGDVVRAFEHEAVEHLHPLDLLARFDGEAAFADGRVLVLDYDFCIQLTGFDDQKCGHHFGRTGWVEGFVGIFFEDDFAGTSIDADGASGCETEGIAGLLGGEW
jgi:hypothetical protein